jgi:hypothetical protein
MVGAYPSLFYLGTRTPATIALISASPNLSGAQKPPATSSQLHQRCSTEVVLWQMRAQHASEKSDKGQTISKNRSVAYRRQKESGALSGGQRPRC